MRRLGVDFTVAVADIDESFTSDVSEIAHAKWHAVADSRRPHEVVIASDTLVFCDGVALGKPHDRDHARAMIATVCGSEIIVRTAVAIGTNQRKPTRTVTETSVQVRALSSDEIERYVASGVADDKAAGLALQDADARFVEQVDGCWPNVVGLPVCVVAKALGRSFGPVRPFSECSPVCPGAARP